MPAAMELPPIPGGQREVLELAARREGMTGSEGSALLRVSNGEGVQLWIPVNARRAVRLPANY